MGCGGFESVAVFEGGEDVLAFGVGIGAGGDAAFESNEAVGEGLVAVDVADPAGQVAAGGVVV